MFNVIPKIGIQESSTKIKEPIGVVLFDNLVQSLPNSGDVVKESSTDAGNSDKGTVF